MVCPLSATMSSVPEDNKFIDQGAAVWKSGWAKMNWGKKYCSTLVWFYKFIFWKINLLNFRWSTIINKLDFVEIN